MKKNRVKLYPSDNVIEEFYEALASKNERKLKQVHIPKSDVFYSTIFVVVASWSITKFLKCKYTLVDWKRITALNNLNLVI